MKKHLLLFATLLPMLVSAEAVKIKGIWYHLNTEERTAEVTRNPNNIDRYTEKSITIPSNVTYEEIEYSVTSIGENAFSHSKSLTSLTIPEGVKNIGAGAFYFSEKLTTVKIPESITSIGERAFAYCKSLTAITIPEGVTKIERSTFRICI